VRGQKFCVKGRDGLVVDQHVLPPRLVLELRDVGDEFPVVDQERPPRRQRAGYQRLADEHVACRLRVDGAVGHWSSRHQRQSVQRHALAGDDFATPFFPMGFEMIAGHALTCDFLDPLGFDPGRAARKEP